MPDSERHDMRDEPRYALMRVEAVAERVDALQRELDELAKRDTVSHGVLHSKFDALESRMRTIEIDLAKLQPSLKVQAESMVKVEKQVEMMRDLMVKIMIVIALISGSLGLGGSVLLGIGK